MTRPNIQHLIALCPAASASAHLDVGAVFRTAHAPMASANPLLKQPDALWRISRKLAAQTRGTIIIPDDPAFRWVAAALDFFKGDASSPDAVTVDAAIRISEDPHLRPILEAALVAPDSTAANVAEGLGLEPDLVACYADLFFNVPDRRSEHSYVHRLVYGNREEDPDSLMVLAHRTDVDTLLTHVGYKSAARDDRDPKWHARDVYAKTMAAARVQLAVGGLHQQRTTPALTHALRMLQGITPRDLDEDRGSTSLFSQMIQETLAGDVMMIKADFERKATEEEAKDRAEYALRAEEQPTADAYGLEVAE